METHCIATIIDKKRGIRIEIPDDFIMNWFFDFIVYGYFTDANIKKVKKYLEEVI